MSRSGYSALPVSQESHYSAAEDEMERAFESDDEDHENTPLARIPVPSVQPTEPTQPREGTYDFEREYEYDRPPPGSPPASTPPTTAFGNSNGIIPSPSDILRREPRTHGAKPSFFRRAVGALLPQHYARIPSSEPEVRGSGLENDGVFSNVSARPTPPRTVQDDNGDVHVMPEDAQSDVPPSYAAAQADSAPPYWETTIHAPSLGGADDFLIEGLPAGTIFSFAWNFLISVSFQFVGFMLTYLLHTSHAAKYGSRAGLGVTLIQYGLFSKASGEDIFRDGNDEEVGTTSLSGKIRRFWATTSDEQEGNPPMWISGSAMHDWISFLLMTVGWVLLLSSILGFARVKRWERSIRTPTPPPVITPEDQQRDEEVRQHLRDVFGFDVITAEDIQEESPTEAEHPNPNQNPHAAQVEERMRRDLRAMGLI